MHNAPNIIDKCPVEGCGAELRDYVSQKSHNVTFDGSTYDVLSHIPTGRVMLEEDTITCASGHDEDEIVEAVESLTQKESNPGPAQVPGTTNEGAA
jgi:hypothetical protein